MVSRPWRDIHKLGIYGFDATVGPIHGPLRSAREQQLAHSFDALRVRLAEMGRRLRTVVWEHSRHVSDARAADTIACGLDQVVRERHGRSGRR